jgi:hypothetical protein
MPHECIQLLSHIWGRGGGRIASSFIGKYTLTPAIKKKFIAHLWRLNVIKLFWLVSQIGLNVVSSPSIAFHMTRLVLLKRLDTGPKALPPSICRIFLFGGMVRDSCWPDGPGQLGCRVGRWAWLDMMPRLAGRAGLVGLAGRTGRAG